MRVLLYLVTGGSDVLLVEVLSPERLPILLTTFFGAVLHSCCCCDAAAATLPPPVVAAAASAAAASAAAAVAAAAVLPSSAFPFGKNCGTTTINFVQTYSSSISSTKACTWASCRSLDARSRARIQIVGMPGEETPGSKRGERAFAAPLIGWLGAPAAIGRSIVINNMLRPIA